MNKRYNNQDTITKQISNLNNQFSNCQKNTPCLVIDYLKFGYYLVIVSWFLVISFVFQLCSPIAFADTLKFSTFHPSPFGVLDRLWLKPRPQPAPPCLPGTIFVNSTDNFNLYFCNGSPAWVPLGAQSVWSQNSPPNDWVYPSLTSTNPNIKVGIGTTTPQFSLNIRNGGILAIGRTGMAAPVISPGAGTRFHWYAVQGALRAGSVDGIGSAYWDSANLGTNTVTFGHNNKMCSPYSSILGGENNTDQGCAANGSVIMGGLNNLVWGYYSVIGGGAFNQAQANSFVGGGLNNLALNPNSGIMGGAYNQISPTHIFGAYHTVIGGGYNNMILPTVAGGALFDVLDGCAIGGGYSNLISGTENQYSIIIGGYNNEMCNSTSAVSDPGRNVIGGGWNNRIWTNSSCMAPSVKNAIILGGYSNVASESWATIGGGMLNFAGQWGFVGGGSGNILSTTNYATVVGGGGNQILGGRGFVGGGYGNIINSGLRGTIAGGYSNNVTQDNNFVGAGRTNMAQGDVGYSVIPGGSGNIARNRSWVAGQNNQALAGQHRSFVWGFRSVAGGFSPDSFIIYSDAGGPMSVGIGTLAPTARLQVHDGNMFVNGSVTLNYPLSSITGGYLWINSTPFHRIGYDIAETFAFNTGEAIEVGDLLVMDKAKGEPRVTKNNSAYDSMVVGVVSFAPAVLLEGNQMQVSPKPLDLSEKDRSNLPVALSGRVPCKVTLENGPIEPGDLLTPSSKAGYAMKAGDVYQSFDAIVGKALEAFGNGLDGKEEGLIMILVTR